MSVWILKVIFQAKLKLNKKYCLYRRWSKKYPICITMDYGALIESAILNESMDFEKESFEDEKKSTQIEGTNQKDEENTLGEETKNEEDEESKWRIFNANEEEELKLYEDEDDDDLSQSKSISSIYEDCRDDEEITKCKLYVFARADREKEDW